MSKITESARGEDCLVRIPGVCNRDPSTVVFAHLNGGGMGTKHPDSEGAYCCSACHDVYDGRAKFHIRRMHTDQMSLGDWDEDDDLQMSRMSIIYVDVSFYEACVRTRAKLIEKGLLILK